MQPYKPKFLNQYPKEQQTKLKALLDKDIELTQEQIEVMKRGIKKLHARIHFFKDVQKSRKSLGNLTRILTHKKQKLTLTKDDLGKIERWARAYLTYKHLGVSYWDLHGNDSLTYRKVCKLLGINPAIK